MSDKHDHGPVVRPEQVNIGASSIWRTAPMGAAAVGGICLAAAFAIGSSHHTELYAGYITAYMGFLSLTLGGIFFVLIQHATRAGWSIAVRRLAENMGLTGPLMGVLMLPLAFHAGPDVFHWMDPVVQKTDAVIQAKSAYLNQGFFQTRVFIYIAVWSLLGVGLWRMSTTQDKDREPKKYSLTVRFWTPVGLLLFGLSTTFAAFDVLMSLDPHWFSTIFGVYYFGGCVLSTHAFIALMVILLQRSGYLNGVVSHEHFHDLGKMMFAFTVFWGYIGFSQFMLYWYASIPEETEWYAYRGSEASWLTLTLVLIFVRFVIPFPGLLSRHIKRRSDTMAFWATWVVLAEFVDMFWLVHPVITKTHDGLHSHFEQMTPLSVGVLDILTFLGIGGVWLAVFLWATSRYPLVPLKDPRLAESVHFQNF